MTEEEMKAKAAEEAKAKADAEAAAKAADTKTEPVKVEPPPVPASLAEAPAARYKRQAEEAARAQAEAEAKAREAAARAANAEKLANDSSAQIATLTRMFQEAEQRRYDAELSAYRDRVVASYQGRIIVEMVASGPDANAITTSAQRAAAKYEEMYAEFTRLRAAAAQTTTNTNATPGVQQVRVEPPAPQVSTGAPPANVMPQVPNGAAPQDPGVHGQPTIDLSQYTNPDAIRDGSYARHRAEILAHVSGKRAPAPPQAFPTTQAYPGKPPMAMPQQNFPGGIQNPTGFPTPPAVTPQQMAQLQQVQQTMMNPSHDEMAQAMAAIDRARTGKMPNSVAGDPLNAGATRAGKESQQYQQATGVNAMDAFAARFAKD